MDILYARCAGLDIHRDTIVACVRLAEAGGVVRFVETPHAARLRLDPATGTASGEWITQPLHDGPLTLRRPTA